MAGGPIYKGGRPFTKPGIRFSNNLGIFPTTGAPTNGTTLANIAGPGSMLMRTNGTTYVNVGTKASPVWVANGMAGGYQTLGASITYDANVTAATITGLSFSVVAAGTYVFDYQFATTMTTVGGLTISFKLTTATLTSIRYNTYAATATDNATAVSTTGTTTTDATKMFDSKTAAYTNVRVYGSFVVNAGGTFAFQGCQNTSGTAGDVTILLIGSFGKFLKVA